MARAQGHGYWGIWPGHRATLWPSPMELEKQFNELA